MSGKDPKNLPVWMVSTTWFLRVVVGSVFLLSGWAKAIDPWGGLLKFNDYMMALGVTMSRPVVLVGVFTLFIYEMCCGAMLILGTFRRAVTWLLASFMVVMTGLTVWIYISNPVSDCGCFGDLWVISNGMTLVKNLALCAMVGVLIWLNPKVSCGIARRLQWTVPAFTCLYAIAIGVAGFNWQPAVDFRPYPVGSSFVNTDDDNIKFVYEKNGEQQAFTADSLPGDDWTFVAREEHSGESNAIAVFQDGEDVTSDLSEWSELPGGLLVLNVPEPKHHGISRSRQANLTAQYMAEIDGKMIAVIGDANEKTWADAVKAQYDVLSTDATDLHMLSRGDASYVYLRNDSVIWKYNINALSPEPIHPEQIKAFEKRNWLRNQTLIYVASLLVVFILSFFGLKIFKSRRKVAADVESSATSDEIRATQRAQTEDSK